MYLLRVTGEKSHWGRSQKGVQINEPKTNRSGQSVSGTLLRHRQLPVPEDSEQKQDGAGHQKALQLRSVYRVADHVRQRRGSNEQSQDRGHLFFRRNAADRRRRIRRVRDARLDHKGVGIRLHRFRRIFYARSRPRGDPVHRRKSGTAHRVLGHGVETDQRKVSLSHAGRFRTDSRAAEQDVGLHHAQRLHRRGYRPGLFSSGKDSRSQGDNVSADRYRLRVSAQLFSPRSRLRTENSAYARG